MDVCVGNKFEGLGGGEGGGGGEDWLKLSVLRELVLIKKGGGGRYNLTEDGIDTLFGYES